MAMSFEPWILGALLAGNVAVWTRVRYLLAVRRAGVDFGALAYYQASGYWLAAWLGLVAATLPGRLVPTLAWVVSAALIAGLAVTRIEGRS